MGEGIFEQMKKGNVYHYKHLTKRTLLESLDTIFKSERYKLVNKLESLNNISYDQAETIKTLIYSELDEDFILAKQIINTLKK